MNRSQVAALVMCSAEPSDGKPDHHTLGPGFPLAGRPMVDWLLDALVGASIRRISVVGLTTEHSLRHVLADRADGVIVDVAPHAADPIEMLALAIERLGPAFSMHEDADVIVVPSDIPQVTSSVLRVLVDHHVQSGAAATVLTSSTPADADPVLSFDERGSIGSILEPLPNRFEGTAAVVCIRASLLVPALRRVTPQRWSRELLLDDALTALDDAGHEVAIVEDTAPVRRLTNPHDRVLIEGELRGRILSRWLDRGVYIADPRQVWIDGTVELGRGVRILPGTVLEGATVIGDEAVIGPNTHVIDGVIGAGVVAPNCVVHGSDVPPHEVLSPFTVVGTPPH